MSPLYFLETAFSPPPKVGDTMVSDHQLKTLYTEAYTFLEDRIGREALENKLSYYRQYKVTGMHEVCWHLVRSLKNKRNMGQTIGDIELLAPFLFHFDPAATHFHYGDDWRLLFEEIQNKHKPPGPMNIENQNSYWVIFTKGIVSGAAFLSRFDSFEAFDGFVNSFAFNDLSLAALPILLDQEMYGLGFPLACDFLKECGYQDYAKPDVHITGILFESGLVSSRDNYEVFRTMVRIGRASGELPVIVDYVLWMIGSGRFTAEPGRITRQKQAFLQHIRPKLNLKDQL